MQNILPFFILALFPFVTYGNGRVNEQLDLVSAYLCPAAGGSQSSHFYSPSGFNLDDKVAEQCELCLNAENTGHEACQVDRFIRSKECAGAMCTNAQGAFLMQHAIGDAFALQYDLRFKNQEIYKLSEGENCRYIFWTLDPAIGIEDFRQHKSGHYWQQAFQTSQHLVSPPFPLMELALGIQPATKRGQHRLHIHIGRLGSGYRDAIDTLSLSSDITQKIVINNFQFFVRYVPSEEGNDPLSGRNIFEVASEIIPGGDLSMPLYGVLVAISKNKKGVFVLAAKNWERYELNFKQQHDCQFNLADPELHKKPER